MDKSGGKKKPGAKAKFRLMKSRARQKLSKGKGVLRYIARINDLKSELELLTSYSTDAIYRLSYRSMRYDYVSPSVERLLGYTPEEMAKINFRSLILETRIVTDGLKSIESYDKLEERRRKGDASKWQADYLIRRKEGTTIWVSDISYPWIDKTGRVIGSVGCLRDIGDRMEAEEKVRRELVRLANTDPLTGLANRRLFFERLDEEVRRLRRSRSETSVLLIDIDNFKKINDSYGHVVGDFVIAEIAGIVKSCLRDTDIAARLGGEEYGALLPDTPQEGAFWVAERMRERIAAHTFTYEEGEGRGFPRKQIVGLTVSIGVAEASYREQLSSNELYKNADSKLYVAKNLGRNQVFMDEEVFRVH